ncbi:MAG: two-component sensor histidine kinase [Bacteroidetes bacterium]|nr:two-component sensor histidine kinase [Bacteroidota bacterium]
MTYSARILALFLAVSIVMVTALFLSLIEGLTNSTLLLILIISFFASFLMSFVVFKFMFFRGINKIDKMMNKLLKNELKGFSKEKSEGLDPFEKLNEGIAAFALLKQQEIEELKRLESFRKEFIANVSHELKTPLFAAQGFVHTLIDGAADDKNVRVKFLKKAAKSLDGLDDLVRDLLTLSQIETGAIKMKFKTTDLYTLSKEIIDQFEDSANKKNIEIRLLPAQAQKIWVRADEQRIGQVLTNLISNAVNYSPENGTVTVYFEIGKKKTTTFVSDTGKGISEKHLPRIFERFYRADISRSREKGGTGLGLAIVKHILEGHHTKAEVQTEVGKGSTFSFKLKRPKRVGEESIQSNIDTE